MKEILNILVQIVVHKFTPPNSPTAHKIFNPLLVSHIQQT
jgi:hypothetical protein